MLPILRYVLNKSIASGNSFPYSFPYLYSYLYFSELIYRPWSNCDEDTELKQQQLMCVVIYSQTG